jgi:hypothetical protein
MATKVQKIMTQCVAFAMSGQRTRTVLGNGVSTRTRLGQRLLCSYRRPYQPSFNLTLFVQGSSRNWYLGQTRLARA